MARRAVGFALDLLGRRKRFFRVCLGESGLSSFRAEENLYEWFVPSS